MQVSMSNHKSTESAIKNLEIQVGQLAKKIAENSSRGFGANTEKNPKKECKVVMTRSKREIIIEDESRTSEEKELGAEGEKENKGDHMEERKINEAGEEKNAKKRDNEEEKKIKSELAREKKKEKKIKVRQFTFPANFVIMDIEEDVEIPLILGRSFMLTTNCVVDMGKGNLEMSVDDQKVTFNLFEAMKHPSDHKAYFKAEKVEHEVDMVARAMVL